MKMIVVTEISTQHAMNRSIYVKLVALSVTAQPARLLLSPERLQRMPHSDTALSLE